MPYVCQGSESSHLYAVLGNVTLQNHPLNRTNNITLLLSNFFCAIFLMPQGVQYIQITQNVSRIQLPHFYHSNFNEDTNNNYLHVMADYNKWQILKLYTILSKLI